MSTENFNISDTSNNRVDIESLITEIQRASGVTTSLSYPTPVLVSFTTFTVTFKSALDGGEQAALAAVVAAHKGEPTVSDPVDDRGIPRVASSIPMGRGERLCSHNFCDSCTWWQFSKAIVDGATNRVGDVFNILFPGDQSNDRIIDLRSARMTNEDLVTSDMTSQLNETLVHLIPEVKQDGVVIDPSEYTLDPEAATITFDTPPAGGVVVTVSCRYPTSSRYVFHPPMGSKWTFEDAELDVTSDVDMIAPVRTRVWGSRPEPPPVGSLNTVVILGGRTYKKVRDFHALARRFYGPLPASFGGSGSAGVDAWTFEWQYARADSFYSTTSFKGEGKWTFNETSMEIEGDVEFPGTYMSVIYFGPNDSEA